MSMICTKCRHAGMNDSPNGRLWVCSWCGMVKVKPYNPDNSDGKFIDIEEMGK